MTPVVAKTSTGAVEHVPIARVTNLSQTLDKLKEAGFLDFWNRYEWNAFSQMEYQWEASPHYWKRRQGDFSQYKENKWMK